MDLVRNMLRYKTRKCPRNGVQEFSWWIVEALKNPCLRSFAKEKEMVEFSHKMHQTKFHAKEDKKVKRTAGEE